MKTRRTQLDVVVLLGGAALALVGVVGLTTTHHTYRHGHGELVTYLRENAAGILVAALVVIICVLEVAGVDWDHGFLNQVLDAWDANRRVEEEAGISTGMGAEGVESGRGEGIR